MGTNIKIMTKEIAEFLENKKILSDKIKIYVQDKNIDLEKRWVFFIQAIQAELVPNLRWIEHFTGEVENWLDLDVLDGETVEKYQKFSALESVDLAEVREKSEEFIKDLKEQWMDKFISYFIFNW